MDFRITSSNEFQAPRMPGTNIPAELNSFENFLKSGTHSTPRKLTTRTSFGGGFAWPKKSNSPDAKTAKDGKKSKHARKGDRKNKNKSSRENLQLRQVEGKSKQLRDSLQNMQTHAGHGDDLIGALENELQRLKAETANLSQFSQSRKKSPLKESTLYWEEVKQRPGEPQPPDFTDHPPFATLQELEAIREGHEARLCQIEAAYYRQRPATAKDKEASSKPTKQLPKSREPSPQRKSYEDAFARHQAAKKNKAPISGHPRNAQRATGPTAPPRKFETAEEVSMLKWMFSKLDKDNSGEIDKVELLSEIHNSPYLADLFGFGQEIQREDYMVRFSNLFENIGGDDTISFDEFHMFFQVRDNKLTPKKRIASNKGPAGNRQRSRSPGRDHQRSRSPGGDHQRSQSPQKRTSGSQSAQNRTNSARSPSPNKRATSAQSPQRNAPNAGAASAAEKRVDRVCLLNAKQIGLLGSIFDVFDVHNDLVVKRRNLIFNMRRDEKIGKILLVDAVQIAPNQTLTLEQILDFIEKDGAPNSLITWKQFVDYFYNKPRFQPQSNNKDKAKAYDPRLEDMTLNPQYIDLMKQIFDKLPKISPSEVSTHKFVNSLRADGTISSILDFSGREPLEIDGRPRETIDQVLRRMMDEASSLLSWGDICGFFSKRGVPKPVDYEDQGDSTDRYFELGPEKPKMKSQMAQTGPQSGKTQTGNRDKAKAGNKKQGKEESKNKSRDGPREEGKGKGADSGQKKLKGGGDSKGTGAGSAQKKPKGEAGEEKKGKGGADSAKKKPKGEAGEEKKGKGGDSSQKKPKGEAGEEKKGKRKDSAQKKAQKKPAKDEDDEFKSWEQLEQEAIDEINQEEGKGKQKDGSGNKAKNAKKVNFPYEEEDEEDEEDDEDMEEGKGKQKGKSGNKAKNAKKVNFPYEEEDEEDEDEEEEDDEEEDEDDQEEEKKQPKQKNKQDKLGKDRKPKESQQRSSSANPDQFSITVPEPFSFDSRDKYKQKGIRERWLENYMMELEAEEMKECHKKVKVNTVPPESKVMLLDTINRENESRRHEILRSSKEMTLANERPFSFYYRDIEKKQQRESLKPEEKVHAKSFVNPIPWKVTVPLYEKMVTQDQAAREERISAAARRSLERSKLPPRMQQWEETRKKKEHVPMHHSWSDSSFKAKKVPDFKRQQEAFKKSLDAKKTSKRPVESKPFHFESDKRMHKKSIKNAAHYETVLNNSADAARQWKKRANSLSALDAVKIQPTKTAKYEDQVKLLQKRTQDKIKKEKEKSKLDKARRKRKEDLRPYVQDSSYLNDNAEALKEQMAQSKANFAASIRESAEDYRQSLQDMKERVKNRKLLFEQDEQTTKTKDVMRMAKIKQLLRTADVLRAQGLKIHGYFNHDEMELIRQGEYLRDNKMLK